MPKQRHVAFSGAEVIEYNAALAPVVKLCGALGCVNGSSLMLECEARGLEVSDERLTLHYIEELQRSLRSRGFEPMSCDLKELQTQRQVVELLLAWTTLGHQPVTMDVLDPTTLQRVQLEKKQLEARVDDGYAFGRRFFSVSTYVESLSSEELLAVAKERDMELPKLDEKQRAGVKALDRELLGLYGTAEGRPLRSLTLRQLVTEAEGRGMLGPGGEKARDSKGKKSKRAWVDLLRPVMVAEVRAAKIREQQEEMLREQLVKELEQEKEQEQKQRVVELIQTLMKRSEGSDCGEPEDDDATISQESDSKVDKTHRYLEALVKSVCISRETQQDVAMD
ncbi:Cytochrome P450 86A2 [Phytophthora nicotianae]|uniref:Cytochrome P450 86A2 n=1 Tax=Phytophthora nicotianae TaxID=4792 RepID=A0A0W8DUY1_PHYNI|nr:Cytochrome P450 86A2 [Phytophthora nicotianae]